MDSSPAWGLLAVSHSLAKQTPSAPGQSVRVSVSWQVGRLSSRTQAEEKVTRVTPSAAQVGSGTSQTTSTQGLNVKTCRSWRALALSAESHILTAKWYSVAALSPVAVNEAVLPGAPGVPSVASVAAANSAG